MQKPIQYIHTKQIDAISGGDNGFKKELIDIFLEQIPEFVTNMEVFFKDKKWEELAREAHTAKSSALTFGMEPAGVLLKEIQSHSEQMELDVLPELINEVLGQLKAAVPELEEMKATL